MRVAGVNRSAGERPDERPVLGLHAFSLLEVVVVLALMSILGAILVDSLFVRIVQRQREESETELNRITDGVERVILRTRTVPSAADLPEFVAAEIDWPAAQVSVNRSGYARKFLWDPSFRLGASTNGLPTYVQSSAGSVAPIAPRLIVISCIANSLPSVGSSQAAFDDVWATAEGSVPTSWTGWSANGLDLHIRRLSVQGVFHRLLLNNIDSSNSAIYSIEGSTNVVLAPRQQQVAWFVHGSPMVFCYADGSIQASEFLDGDVAYSHENGRWGKEIDRASPSPYSGFGSLIEQFVAVGVGSRVPQYGATPQAVVDEYFTYLRSVVVWATGDPPLSAAFEKGGSSPSQQKPPYRLLMDGEARLRAATVNLIQ